MRARLVVRAAGALLAVTLAAACGADRTDVAAKAPLEATPWELDISTVQVPGIEKAQPTLELAQGVVSGFAGCNTYRGPYFISGANNLRFGELATTLMACEPAGTAIEAAYLNRLGKVAHYQLTQTGLDLEDAGGARILAFVPANTSLAGQWTITGVLLASKTAFSSVSEPPPTAGFQADGTMSANTGCNTAAGPWTQGPGGGREDRTARRHAQGVHQPGTVDPGGVHPRRPQHDDDGGGHQSVGVVVQRRRPAHDGVGALSFSSYRERSPARR